VTRDDFRPRTKPGYYRTNGGYFIRVDKLVIATNYGKLTPKDWLVVGVHVPDASRCTRDGPAPGAPSATYCQPLPTYKKSRWYRIPRHRVPKGWLKFFDATP